jgi:hypothetical protein
MAQVVKSTDEAAMPVGSFVSAFGGVQEYTVQPIAALNPVVPGVPLSLNHSLFSAGEQQHVLIAAGRPPCVCRCRRGCGLSARRPLG